MKLFEKTATNFFKNYFNIIANQHTYKDRYVTTDHLKNLRLG